MALVRMLRNALLRNKLLSKEITAALARMAPQGATFAVEKAADYTAMLYASEAAVVAKSVPARRSEFSRGVFVRAVL